jgi:N-acetylneuraminate lyase
MIKLSEDGDGEGRIRPAILRGLIAAPHTPMKPDGSLNLSVIAQQAEHLVGNGISGAFICGTTGEGSSLTTQERMEVARRWVEVAGPDLPVIVHVGHNCQADAIALARHSQTVGAAGIAAVSCSYFRPSNARQAVSFCEPIAAAAPELPFYYYHIPSMVGFSLPMTELAAISRERIPTMRGIKYTHGDLMEYQRCLSLADDAFQVAWGVDEMLLGALAVGARAAVGSTYNYSAPIYRRMIAAFNAGDLAAAQADARLTVELISHLLKFGGVRTGKAIMKMIGIDCGPPRPPLQPLNNVEYRLVYEAYQQLHFFDEVALPQPARVASIAH